MPLEDSAISAVVERCQPFTGDQPCLGPEAGRVWQLLRKDDQHWVRIWGKKSATCWLNDSQGELEIRGGTYNLRVTPPQRVVLLGSHDVYGSCMILPSTSKPHSNFVKGTFVASHGPRWVFPVDRFGEANWRKVSYRLFLQTPCSTCVEKLLCEVYRHVGTVWRYMIYNIYEYKEAVSVEGMVMTTDLWSLYGMIGNVSLVHLRATCTS